MPLLVGQAPVGNVLLRTQISSTTVEVVLRRRAIRAADLLDSAAIGLLLKEGNRSVAAHAAADTRTQHRIVRLQFGING